MNSRSTIQALEHIAQLQDQVSRLSSFTQALARSVVKLSEANRQQSDEIKRLLEKAEATHPSQQEGRFH